MKNVRTFEKGIGAQVKTVSVELPESAYRLRNILLDRPVINALPEEDMPSYAVANDSIELYPYAPESTKKDDVPAGQVTNGMLEDSVYYPGVSHAYAVYVPAGYDPAEPANLLILPDMVFHFLDDYYPMRTPVMLDNLIAQGDIPKTIAVFVGTGNPGPGVPVYGTAMTPDNRSVEYDAVDDRYVKFLMEELLPVALKGLNVSSDPADVCIAGTSSGANMAMTAAWHRNDVFGNVIGVSGSFVNIRGGDVWPSAIRAGEKKNLKVFLAAGEKDMNTLLGDFLLANKSVFSALKYRGYHARLVVAKCGHSLQYLGHVLPDALRFIWGDESKLPINSEAETI